MTSRGRGWWPQRETVRTDTHEWTITRYEPFVIPPEGTFRHGHGIYRCLVGAVETVAPDPAQEGDAWIMDPDEAFAMSLRPILERLADDAPAQEESWQEPLRQPDEEL